MSMNITVAATPFAVENPQNGVCGVARIFSASGPSLGALPHPCPIVRFRTIPPLRRRHTWMAGVVPIAYHARTEPQIASTSAREDPTSAGSSSWPIVVTASRSSVTVTSGAGSALIGPAYRR
ncbi:hypothetical protein ACWZHB_09420 [Nocardia sp. FBN12]|uniref:hypothetical protein n=1 Tax=Nocardia sp. FBN12 TaxID=3419766 RepID=UPI003D086246